MSLEDDLAELVRRRRLYASLREGGTKEQKELGALTDLIESMKRAGESVYRDPANSPVDPPDCTARTMSGELVAVEVTEFVSQQAIEINERAKRAAGGQPRPRDLVYCQWNKEDFLSHVTAQLREKDSKTYLGGPYAEIIVLIHTDESFLFRADCEKWLAGQSFGPFTQINTAFLLCPYEPPIGYPYLRLPLRHKEPAPSQPQ
jgi:hypothetical protein